MTKRRGTARHGTRRPNRSSLELANGAGALYDVSLLHPIGSIELIDESALIEFAHDSSVDQAFGFEAGDGGVALLTALADRFPLLAKLFADGAYQGPQFRQGVAKVRPQLATEIITRREQAKGFVALPKRWIVERTLAWLNRNRRLAKDFENRTRYALAFVHLASIRLMSRKLCNPS